MKIWENRRLMMFIMVFMIIFSILFGSHRTLASLKEDLTEVFYQGADNDGYGIQNDLERVIDSSSRLLSIASLYVRGDDIDLVDKVSEAQLALVNASSIHDKYLTYQQLDSLIDQLYYILDDYSLNEAHKVAIRTLYYDISEAKDKIGHNQYNTQADQFNQALMNFPANILSKLTFITKADTFR